MDATPVRFALVGAGAIAQTWAEALRRTPAARLAAVVDPHAPAAAALAETEGCAALPSHAGVEAHADAAIVCAPPALHERLTCELLAAGLDVLCEKPLAIDLAGARRMVAAARRHGRLLSMASKFRFAEDVVRARSLLAGGVVGEPVLYQNVFTARVDMSRRWNADAAVAGGGVLIDNGCHAADLLRYLIGPVREVMAVEAPRIAGLPVEETVHLLARTAGDTLATIDLSWSVHEPLEQFVLVLGSRGTLSIGWTRSRYKALGASEWVDFGAGYRKIDAFAAQLADFLSARRDGREPRISHADALASVAVTAAAYDSMRRGAWVAVPAATDPAAADD